MVKKKQLNKDNITEALPAATVARLFLMQGGIMSAKY